MNPSLTLNVQAAPPLTETVAGWQFESYALSGTARGPEQAPEKVALAPDDVLEIELETARACWWRQKMPSAIWTGPSDAMAVAMRARRAPSTSLRAALEKLKTEIESA